MSFSVNQYRVYCTDPTAHYETTWGTSEPTVCPSDGSAIDTNATTIIQTISSNSTSVTNFPTTVFGELATKNSTPFIQLVFSYNLPLQQVKTQTTGIGTVTQANHMAVVSTGASTSSSGTLSSIKPLKYRPGQGMLIRFSAIFTAGVAGSTQRIGGFDTDDGLGFGFNGTSFGIFRLSDGVTTWTQQSNWNGDKLDGTGPSGVNINFGDGNGNVFQIKFQFLGFGGLEFYVENPSTSGFILVHTIEYANTSTVPSFHIPSFPIAMSVTNTTNNTNIVMKTTSMAGFVEGQLIYSGSQFLDTWRDVTVPNGSQAVIKALQIKTTFQGHLNKTIAYGTRINMATGTTDKPQILRLYKNATFTSPVWTDISTTQSTMQKLTGGTWNGNGTLVSVIDVPGKGDIYDNQITISETSLYGTPGENLVFTLEGIGGSGSSTGTIFWLEDQ